MNLHELYFELLIPCTDSCNIHNKKKHMICKNLNFLVYKLRNLINPYIPNFLFFIFFSTQFLDLKLK